MLMLLYLTCLFATLAAGVITGQYLWAVVVIAANLAGWLMGFHQGQIDYAQTLREAIRKFEGYNKVDALNHYLNSLLGED